MLDDAVMKNVCTKKRATNIRRWYREAEAKNQLTYKPPPVLQKLVPTNPGPCSTVPAKENPERRPSTVNTEENPGRRPSLVNARPNLDPCSSTVTTKENPGRCSSANIARANSMHPKSAKEFQKQVIRPTDSTDETAAILKHDNPPGSNQPLTVGTVRVSEATYQERSLDHRVQQSINRNLNEIRLPDSARTASTKSRTSRLAERLVALEQKFTNRINEFERRFYQNLLVQDQILRDDLREIIQAAIRNNIPPVMPVLPLNLPPINHDDVLPLRNIPRVRNSRPALPPPSRTMLRNRNLLLSNTAAAVPASTHAIDPSRRNSARSSNPPPRKRSGPRDKDRIPSSRKLMQRHSRSECPPHCPFYPLGNDDSDDSDDDENRIIGPDDNTDSLETQFSACGIPEDDHVHNAKSATWDEVYDENSADQHYTDQDDHDEDESATQDDYDQENKSFGYDDYQEDYDESAGQDYGDQTYEDIDYPEDDD